MDVSRVIQFPGVTTAEEIIENLYEYKGLSKDIIILSCTHEGKLNFAWSDLRYIEILGMIDILRQEIMDRLRD